MENQHRKIKGYRELTQAEIDMMNRIKEKGVELGALVEELTVMQSKAFELPYNSAIEQTSSYDAANEGLRWTSIGKDHLQQGLMALTRSVARPEFF